MQTQGDIGVFCCVFGSLFQRDLVEADLPRALARYLFILDGLDAEMAQREAIHVMRAMRFEHVRLQQRVMLDAVHRDAVVRQHLLVVLHVLADLLVLSAFEPGLEPGEHFVTRQLHRMIRPTMANRNISGRVRLDRQRDADKLRQHRIKRGGFGIEGGQFSCVDLREPYVELFPRLHGVVMTLAVNHWRHVYARAGTFHDLGHFDFAQPRLEAVSRKYIAQFITCFGP